MVSPDSVYSHVSVHSGMKGFIGYDRRDGPNRSPPDGDSYHEEILDIVASVNGKPSHVLDKGYVGLNKLQRICLRITAVRCPLEKVRQL